MLRRIFSNWFGIVKGTSPRSEKVRVVFYADTPDLGGAEHYLVTLVQNIDPGRFEPHLVFTRRPHMGCILEEMLRLGLVCDVIDAASTRPPWRQFWSSFRYFRRIRPHAVHFNRNWNYGFIMPQLAARFAGTKTIVLVEHLAVGVEKKRNRRLGGMLPDLGMWRWKQIITRRLSVLLVDTVIAVSRACKNVLCEEYGYPAHKVLVIPNGVEVKSLSREIRRSEQRSLMGVAETDVLVGAVGRLSHQKGFQYLIPAFELVHRQCPHAKLCIVGEGDRRNELERWIAERGMQSQVILLGHRRDVASLLPCFEVFAFPSLFEGMPFALLEAMAAGLPIVATAIPPIQEALDDGKEGLLVPATNIQALAAALLELIRNRSQRKYLGRQARKRVSKQYSLRISLERTWQLYC